jgi:release factor glutamine methyltransferase
VSDLTWNDIRRGAVRKLREVGVASPEAEARWLVEEAAPDLDGPVTKRAIAHLDSMLGRRERGEPLQYVLGRWAFRSLDLLVDRRVLIPRPETEVVAGAAVEEVRRIDARLAVDLGTGSGAIALALASEVVTLEVWATDHSTDALDVARANLAGMGRAGTRVRLVHGDWFGALPEELRGAIGVIVSNPPYVATDDELPDEVKAWEPTEALLAGEDGLDEIRRIVADAPEWLARPGALVVEFAPHQALTVGALAYGAGFDDVMIGRDLSDRERYLVARVT